MEELQIVTRVWQGRKTLCRGHRPNHLHVLSHRSRVDDARPIKALHNLGRECEEALLRMLHQDHTPILAAAFNHRLAAAAALVELFGAPKLGLPPDTECDDGLRSDPIVDE